MRYRPFRLSLSAKGNRMQDTQGKFIGALMEQLIKTRPEGMAEAFTALFNLAIKMERDRYLGSGLYERTDGRRGPVCFREARGLAT
jgi:hypothetical protein